MNQLLIAHSPWHKDINDLPYNVVVLWWTLLWALKCAFKTFIVFHLYHISWIFIAMNSSISIYHTYSGAYITYKHRNIWTMNANLHKRYKFSQPTTKLHNNLQTCSHMLPWNRLNVLSSISFLHWICVCMCVYFSIFNFNR